MVKFKVRKFKNGSYFITIPKVFAEMQVEQGYTYVKWYTVGARSAYIEFIKEGE